MDAKRCICRGKDFTELLSAWYGRTRGRIVEGAETCESTWSYKDLQMAVTLIRTLHENKGQKAPFLDRFAHLDHHLEDCPCSFRYVAPKAFTGS